jgi:hypothetical protein
MKATVNIGYREVTLEYKIDSKNLLPLTQEERNKNFKKWEMFQKNKNSKIVCKHSIFFEDFDEWQSVLLFDGRTIDFHYDYEMCKEFDTKYNWAHYIFQGYNHIEGEEQEYIDSVVKTIKIEL